MPTSGSSGDKVTLSKDAQFRATLAAACALYNDGLLEIVPHLSEGATVTVEKTGLEDYLEAVSLDEATFRKVLSGELSVLIASCVRGLTAEQFQALPPFATLAATQKKKLASRFTEVVDALPMIRLRSEYVAKREAPTDIYVGLTAHVVDPITAAEDESPKCALVVVQVHVREPRVPAGSLIPQGATELLETLFLGTHTTRRHTLSLTASDLRSLSRRFDKLARDLDQANVRGRNHGD